MSEGVFIGTDLKFLIEITSPGFEMTENEFTVEIRSNKHSRVFPKSELIQDEENKFYVCFNTSEFGTGVIEMIVTALVPDIDFDDGIRSEVYKMDLLTIRG